MDHLAVSQLKSLRRLQRSSSPFPYMDRILPPISPESENVMSHEDLQWGGAHSIHKAAHFIFEWLYQEMFPYTESKPAILQLSSTTPDFSLQGQLQYRTNAIPSLTHLPFKYLQTVIKFSTPSSIHPHLLQVIPVWYRSPILSLSFSPISGNTPACQFPS